MDEGHIPSHVLRQRVLGVGELEGALVLFVVDQVVVHEPEIGDVFLLHWGGGDVPGEGGRCGACRLRGVCVRGVPVDQH